MDNEDLDNEDLDGSDDANNSESFSGVCDDGQTNETTYTEGHTSNAPCRRKMSPTIMSLVSNFNPLKDDVFEGQCFADKQTSISAIKEIHIKNSKAIMLGRALQHSMSKMCCLNVYDEFEL